jgi:hypothetical protein
VTFEIDCSKGDVLVLENGKEQGFAVRNDARLRTGTFYPAIMFESNCKGNLKMVTDHFWNQTDEEARLNMIVEAKKVEDDKAKAEKVWKFLAEIH